MLKRSDRVGGWWGEDKEKNNRQITVKVSWDLSFLFSFAFSMQK